MTNAASVLSLSHLFFVLVCGYVCSCYAIIKVSYCPALFFGQFSCCKIHFAVHKATLFSRDAVQLCRREDISLKGNDQIYDLGLRGSFAEKPQYIAVAVSALGECCCVQDTGDSYSVDGQLHGRFNKVHKKNTTTLIWRCWQKLSSFHQLSASSLMAVFISHIACCSRKPPAWLLVPT